jgi:uncharacterized protein (DUF2252 family)
MMQPSMTSGQRPLITRAERRQFGRSLRDRVSRSGHAECDLKRDFDALGLLLAAQHGRVPQLLPIKWARMAASPFGFLRGCVPIMAADLSRMPDTGIHAQICGDAHVRNLGAYTGADGRLIFDINDFDETTRGPWEWDLKRMAVSLLLAGREAHNSEKQCKTALLYFVESYREAMRDFCAMPVLDLAHFQVSRHLNVSPVLAVLRKAERATPQHNLKRLTERHNGKYRFRDLEPLQFHVPPATVAQVQGALRRYLDTLLPEPRHWFAQYQVHDVAFRVVGTGSIGVRNYAVLMFAAARDDPLFMQLKEEDASVYAPYLSAARFSGNQGQRVAEGGRAMQVQSDIFLGWTSIAGRHYVVRQFRDHKAGIDDEDLKLAGLVQYALVCGEMLAKGHARSGDPCVISGYLGNSDKFDKAIAGFAFAYADQTMKDYQQFTRAIHAGKLRVAKAGS